MNKSKWAGSLACAVALLLSACSSDVLDFRNAEIVNGKIYKAGANEPFTGKVTNIPDIKALPIREGFLKALNILFNGRANLADLNVMAAALILANFDSQCDVNVTDGRLDGRMICNKKNSETRTLELSFKDGSLEGDFRYYGPKGGEHVVSSVSFRGDQPDGKLEIFSTNNQKLIHTFLWKNGVLNGKEETYDENTGAVTGHATYVDGKLDGEVVHYATDGKQVTYKAVFTSGVKNGPEDTYSTTGKRLFHGQWINGNQQGLFQQWDEQGNLVAQKTWNNGVEVTSSTTATQVTATVTNTDDCVSAWTTAFHKENGEDALVTADQIGEWQGWCKEGKRPS